MIPKVLLELIAKYNQSLIAIISQNQIYLFDGNQFYVIANGRAEYITNVSWFNGNLYALHEYPNKTLIYEKSKFVETNRIAFHEIIAHSKNFYVELQGRLLYKNGKMTALKRYYKDGRQILYYNNFIYYFSNFHNEKFDILSKIWSNFADPGFSIGDMKLLTNKFYCFDYHNLMIIYDPVLDTWSKKISISKNWVTPWLTSK